MKARARPYDVKLRLAGLGVALGLGAVVLVGRAVKGVLAVLEQ